MNGGKAFARPFVPNCALSSEMASGIHHLFGEQKENNLCYKVGGSRTFKIMFSQEKSTAAAAFLLRLRGGRMSYLKLIKLLYLADREALHRWGFNITTDRYVAMEHGPVVSHTYELMISEEGEHEFWSQYITPPLGNYEIALRSPDTPEGQLSRAEESLLREIYGTFGTWSRWKVRDYTHQLPEWHDPGKTSVPISVRDILRAQGETTEEIDEVVADLDAAYRADSILGGR